MFAADKVDTLEVQMPLRTDNEGNAYAASKRSAKKWPCSAELSAQEARERSLASLTGQGGHRERVGPPRPVGLTTVAGRTFPLAALATDRGPALLTRCVVSGFRLRLFIH